MRHFPTDPPHDSLGFKHRAFDLIERYLIIQSEWHKSIKFHTANLQYVKSCPGFSFSLCCTQFIENSIERSGWSEKNLLHHLDSSNHKLGAAEFSAITNCVFSCMWRACWGKARNINHMRCTHSDSGRGGNKMFPSVCHISTENSSLGRKADVQNLWRPRMQHDAMAEAASKTTWKVSGAMSIVTGDYKST